MEVENSFHPGAMDALKESVNPALDLTALKFQSTIFFAAES
jgi:hypothetical protein